MKTKYISLFSIVFILFLTSCKKDKTDDIEKLPGNQRIFGSSGDQRGFSVKQTDDGGYIITGETENSPNKSDVLLIKTDANLNMIWSKTIGRSNYHDRGNVVGQTSDGGYYIIGHTFAVGDNNDFYLIKTDAVGDTLWTKSYFGKESYWVKGQQTADGGYIMVGYIKTYSISSYDDVYLVKTNTNGDTLWTKNLGGTAYDMGQAIYQTNDGGYIITGISDSGDGDDVLLVRTNVDGNMLWKKTFGGCCDGWSGNYDDRGNSIQQTADGGFIVLGMTYSYGAGRSDFYLIRTNSNGNNIWERTFGGTGDEIGQSVQQTGDGGFILTGWTNSFGAQGGGGDVYLIRIDANGNTLWAKTFGGKGWNEAYSVQQTADGGYIIVGGTSSFGAVGNDVYLIKTDANGN